MNRNVLIAGLIALVALAFVLLKFGPSSSKTEATESGSTNASSTAITSTAVTADAGGLVDGVHYRSVEQVSLNDTIQVQEFFWYGCPHCQKFEPAIRDYKKSLPDDVELVQIPVTWNEVTGLHAAMHYVAMENEGSEKLRDDLFDKIISIRKEGNLDKHIDDVAAVFADHGIDTDNFRNRLRSPEIQAKVENAAALMQQSGITGTPSVMVDGSWVVLNNEEVAKVGIFAMIDHLISKARTARQ